MPQENLTNNSNPPPAPVQAEPEPIVESALTAQQASETVGQSVPTSEEVKVDFQPEQAQEKEQPAASEGQPLENQQIAEEALKLEEIEEIGETEQSTKATKPEALYAPPVESDKQAEITQPTQTTEPGGISQQDLDKLSEQIIPPAQDITLTEEQKRSFWQKVMQRLAQLSRKKRQNRWQMQKLAILKLLSQKGRIKNDDVEQGLGVSNRSSARYLNRLVNEQLIERHNKKKQAFYLITPAGQKQISDG